MPGDKPTTLLERSTQTVAKHAFFSRARKNIPRYNPCWAKINQSKLKRIQVTRVNCSQRIGVKLHISKKYIWKLSKHFEVNDKKYNVSKFVGRREGRHGEEFSGCKACIGEERSFQICHLNFYPEKRGERGQCAHAQKEGMTRSRGEAGAASRGQSPKEETDGEVLKYRHQRVST